MVMMNILCIIHDYSVCDRPDAALDDHSGR